VKPDITIVNLPAPFLEDQLWIYPLGILNFATYLKYRGYSVEIFDLASFNVSDDAQIVRLLRIIKSPIVGVSVTTPQARFLPLFSVAFKNRNLVVGGSHTRATKEDLVIFGFDVVAGEGDSEAVANIVMGSKDYVLVSDPVEDLDKLPFPDRSFFNNYKGPIPVMAHRGCPYHCSFCSKILGKVRMRSPENVVEELKEISNKYPDKDEIIFYDETFTLDYNWTTKLCELILNRNIRKNLRCSTRADKVEPDLLNLMKSAGFTEICVGVESGSQKILDVLNKKVKVSQNTLARRFVREAGLKFKAYMMLGCPGETNETLEETKQWLIDNRPDSIGLYIFHPMPQSDIWDRPEKYDIKFSKDYDSSYYGGHREDMISTVSTSFLSKRDITKAYWELLDLFGN
jgi:radical SAM superfamily enzyme YgiQ (UPF0313 family)